jgi:prolyl oligopeptidase
MDTIENKNTWKEIVTESEAVLRQFIVIGDNLVLSELYHAHSRLRVISLENGREEIVQLPGMGLIASDGAPDCCPFSAEGDNIYFCYETFVQPSCVYTYNLKTKELKDQGKAPESDLSRITVRQVYYPAKDGAQVPLYLVYKHDLDLTRPHPVLLHGYGGWNINPAPAYIGTGRTCVLPVVEAGGIYAFACLRGGCELGRKWWQDGRREKKQNTFDDFYAAAEYLIREGMTSPEQLAVIGASNGGLLTAVAVTQRPDLFQVVVSEVPLTDMIRALKDPYLSSYTEEYCDPGDPEMLPVLMSYSPLHHIKAGSAYPATFVLSGKNDVRCQPWNGRKLAAHLQNATRSEAPILLRVASGGHGPGLSLQEEVERRTDILGFIMQHLEMSVALD